MVYGDLVYRDDSKKEVAQSSFSKRLFPYLLFFGQKGITPEVTGIIRDTSPSGYVLERDKRIFTIALAWVRKIEGDNLGAWLASCLHENRDTDTIRQMYEELGYRVGFIHKYGVVHNHLKTDNIIIDAQNKPIIIDWKNGEKLRKVDENDTYSLFLNFSDSSALLRISRAILKERLDPKLVQELEKVFRERRIRELQSPLEVTIEDILNQAEQFVLQHS